MFTRATKLHFAAADTPPQLKAAFAELREALTTVARERDLNTLTEVLWAALHGLTVLSRGGRLRPEHDYVRLDLLAAQFTRFAVALASPGQEVGAANGSLPALPNGVTSIQRKEPVKSSERTSAASDGNEANHRQQ